MSGLKLVPRIPKWPSTTNGSEAASSATSATGQPARSASPRPRAAPAGRRPRRRSATSDGDRRDDPVARQPHRPPAERAEQRQADRRREPGPARARRRARSPPGRSPARRRRPPAPLRRSRSRGGEPRLRAWRSSRPPAICCAPRTWPTPATSSRSASTTWPRAAGLSRAHFSREFRRAFGESPHAYLLTRRLERAAALLRNTDRSVADICLAVGLQSVGSFTTSFKRTYGHDADRLPRGASRRPPAHAVSRPASSAPTAAPNTARFEKTARRRRPSIAADLHSNQGGTR